jgi:hypothetical protein
MKNLLFFSLFTILISCSTESGAYKKSNNVENLLLKNTPKPWSEINNEGSDYALQNTKTKSLFLFNSACRKYEASSLNNLTTSLFSGLEEFKELENKSVPYQGREAIEIAATGKLDGVQRFFRIVTFQKNNCIYDFVLISTNQKNLDNDSNDLKLFLQRIILN